MLTKEASQDSALTSMTKAKGRLFGPQDRAGCPRIEETSLYNLIMAVRRSCGINRDHYQAKGGMFNQKNKVKVGGRNPTGTDYRRFVKITLPPPLSCSTGTPASLPHLRAAPIKTTPFFQNLEATLPLGMVQVADPVARKLLFIRNRRLLVQFRGQWTVRMEES